MKLIFGTYLDGTSWSDEQASSGKLQLGPSGMLNFLETRLGLSRPDSHPAMRINQYLQRLQACDSPDAWFHNSLHADAWSTAKQLLAWRDQLIEAGWKGQMDKHCSARLQALGTLEQSSLPLIAGREDRLREILRMLEKCNTISVHTINIQEPFKLLPPVWQTILSRLRDMGVHLHQSLPIIRTDKTSDLAKVQSVLNNAVHKTAAIKDDESLVMAKAPDEWEAAESLALWLAADPAQHKELTIICGADTDVLDQALQRHGLPQLGGSDSSRWRASLQVLPLVMANAWKPVEVQRLIELLSLPMAPIPIAAVRHFLHALRKEPGVGGDAWKEALRHITVEQQNKLSEKGSDNAEALAEASVSMLNAYLAEDRYMPDSGIPEEVLHKRCQWIIEWLGWQAKNDPMLIEALSHAREMQKLAKGKGLIPRITLERMLDSVIGIGCTAPDRIEEAAHWKIVTHPGQITTPCKTIIWWGFIDPQLTPLTYWSKTERDALRKYSIELEDSVLARRREAEAWKRGFNQADETMLLFYPSQMHGEEVYPHPYWDEIRNAAVKGRPNMPPEILLASLLKETSTLTNKETWQLAGRRLILKKMQEPIWETPTGNFTIPADTVSPPDTLSYTKMNTLLACPMKWVLHYHSGLRVPDALSLPTDNQMIGNLCHRIVENLYSGGNKQWTPEDAEAQALKLYDSLTPAMASELLLEGRELDNSRYRRSVAKAVKQLAGAVEQLGLTVEQSEGKLQGDFVGIPFIGYADLLLHDKNGNPFVLDLKWSGSSSYRKKEIEEGSALQLASYAWMLRTTAPEAQIHSAYF
ncbi:MAG: PD-(D/E)XK nuclease family protein, partial [Nitrospira sp.]|nr:PD-(D/E)XK nuclease family protein [Nitrospira sp.]